MKKRISFAMLAAVLVIGLLQLNAIMTRATVYRGGDCWPTNGFPAFYKMEPGSVDVLLFGSSIGVNNYDTQELYDSYGIRSYNLSSVQQPIPLSYYWLKEALRFQTPKVVVLETRFMYEWHPDFVMNAYEGTFREPLDQMRFSPTKVEIVKDYVSQEEGVKEASFYFPFLRYHELWKNFDEDMLFGRDVYTQNLKGFAPGTNELDSYEPLAYGDPQAVSDREFDPVMMEYLARMIELCSRKNIAFVLVTLPGEGMTDGMHNQIREYADANGIEFYDFDEAELFYQIGNVYPEETVYQHSNFGGAVKISRFLGKILREDYHIPEVHDEQYERSRPYHEKLRQNAHLKYIYDLEEYADNLLSERYVIFMAGKHDAAGGITAEDLQLLERLGFSVNWTQTAPEGGYLAVREDGKVREWFGLGKEVGGSVRDGRDSFVMRSAMQDWESSSRIELNGENVCPNRDGINIVVYDKELRYIVDRISIRSYRGGDGSIQR